MFYIFEAKNLCIAQVFDAIDSNRASLLSEENFLRGFLCVSFYSLKFFFIIDIL